MRTLLALPLATAAALLSLAAPARAGTYPMLQCGATAGREVSAGWVTYGPATIFDACGGDDSFGVWLPEMPYDTTGGLTIGVPAALPHITIARVDATMSVARELNQYAFLRWFAGGSILVDREMTGWAQTLSRTPPDDARDFSLDVYCSFGAGPVNCRFDDFHRAVAVTAMTFTLAENDDPTAQATGGSLLADGARNGTESLTLTASDADSGVRSAVVQLGESAVGAYDFSPACAYTDWNACPLNQTRTLDVDTTRVPDGTYPLRLDMADAAGNVRTVDTGHTVTIANRSPAASTGGGAGSEHATGGGGGSEPPAAAVEEAATTDRGHHNGSGAAALAVLTAELVNRRQAMLVPYRRSAVTISGRLTQRDGTPIAGARLDVGSETVVPGLPGPDGGQAITHEDGRWSVTTVPGPSRVVTVAWRAFDRDRSYSETNRLSLLVRAGAALAVHPRRIANGGRVTLIGRLLGKPYPDGGVLVTLQGRPRRGGRWRTFGVTRSKPDGRFRYRYRFSRVAGGVRMFLFRARVNRQDGYPYEAGVAGSAKASVRP
jgi:hypothetical protein